MFSKIANDNIIKKLTIYANELGKQIYVVGGAVRDEILGKIRISDIKDIDIASTLTLNQIIEFANKNLIEYEIKNKKLEVVSLSSGDCCYEIARMRSEEYDSNFAHTPTKISFTDDVIEDAKRRDFTANSIYYATHNNSIIDPFDGVVDVKEKIVRTVLTPDETLSVDPARIIRMVELAARFGFAIEKHTLIAAKKYACNINKLTKQRRKKELERLYQCNKYNGESKFDYLNAVESLIKELDILLQI